MGDLWLTEGPWRILRFSLDEFKQFYTRGGVDPPSFRHHPRGSFICWLGPPGACWGLLDPSGDALTLSSVLVPSVAHRDDTECTP